MTDDQSRGLSVYKTFDTHQVQTLCSVKTIPYKEMSLVLVQ